MRLLFIFIFILMLLSITVFAKSNETCYTVQLISKQNTPVNKQSLMKENFDKSCKVMEIGNSLTVRCGCLENKKSAKEILNNFQKSYKKAIVTSTYKYRFDTVKIAKEMSGIEKAIINPLVKKEKAIHESCYTVQLISLNATQKALNFLSSNSYPENCKLMEIGNNYTVRCGCFDKKDKLQSLYKDLEEKYINAKITKTYKYRFDNKDEIQIVQSTPKKSKAEKITYKKSKTSINEEELRLILQVFLYKGDLENAYVVATIGYKKHPSSYYWNQKMAEISSWTNHSVQSMKHLRKMYDIKQDDKIEEELIKYGVASYQFEEIEALVINKAKNNPSEKNIDRMIYVFKQIGDPEKVIAVLEDQYKQHPDDMFFLTKALSLSLEVGDMESSLRYVDILESNRPYTQKDAALISYYYYVKHDIESAYESLNYVDTLNITDKEDYIKYFELKSDLGWYLQDNYNAALASQELMKQDSARLVDYERISYVYKEKNPKLAAKSSKQAYKKYKLTYLFYTYANSAINRGKYKALSKLMDSIEKEKSPISTEAMYWVIKSKVYGYYKKYKKEEKALLHAQIIAPHNYEIKLILLQYYMDKNERNKLKLALVHMEANTDISTSYYLPLASAYYYLNNINRASYYTQKLIHLEDPVTELIEFRFMQAYIYQMQNNEHAFMSEMKSLTKDFNKQAKQNPKLLKQDRFLSNYLRASIYISDANKFKRKLKKAKKYLMKKNYQDISYSFAMLNGARDKGKKIYNKVKHKELWLRFSNDLQSQNHTQIENLLIRNLDSLATGDASQAAYKDGQKSLAQSIAFEGLRKNDKNQNAYIQHLNISKDRSDKFEIETGYIDRDPLTQAYVKFINTLYLRDGFYLLSDAEITKNKTVNTKQLFMVPTPMQSYRVGLKRLLKKGYIESYLSYNSAIRDFYGISLKVSKQMSTDIITSLKIAKNNLAQEEIKLLLGGKKDIAEVNLLWKVMDSTNLDITYSYNRYSSQDNYYQGSGNYGKLALMYQIRNGYPDMKIGISYDKSFYSPVSNNHGVINKLQKESRTVLPETFYNVGMIFSYGMANSNNYTRVWRPYFEFTPSYNNISDAYNYGFHLGIGGKVYHQDHMSVGIKYSESENGLVGKTYQFYINYHFLYAHPKISKGF